MLEDRDYMRQPEYNDSGWRPRFRPRWSWTVVLIVANLIVFILMEISKAYNPTGFIKIFQYFALSNEGLAHGYVWQYLTFQFLHLGGWHFAGNMLGLFFLGRAIEDMIGSRRFILLYLTSGLFGGVFQTVLGLIFPHVFGVPVAGASAGVFGLLAALAVLEPDGEILVFFVLPVKIKYLAWIGAVVATFYIIVPAEPGVAHAAHLGGMAMGFFFVRYIMRRDWSWLMGSLRSFKKTEPTVPARQPHKGVDQPPQDGFVENEVDPILDKISAHGIQSLTAREREILETARKQIRRS